MYRKTISAIAVAIVSIACASELAQAQETIRLKVLSMNIKEGGKMAGYRTSAFADVIKQYDPDVVAMQEVHDRTFFVGGRAWTTELAEAAGMYPLYCKSFDYSGGGFGVAVMTKYPFFASEYIVSPMSTYPSENVKPGRKPEDRSTGWVYMSLPDGNVVRVGSTHLSVENDIIIKNMFDVNKKIFAEDTVTPTLLIGDYNAVPGSDQIVYFLRKWQDVSEEIGPTIPSDKPKQKLDYIMGYPKGGWKLEKYEIIAREDLSDHCFIYAEVSYIPVK